MTVSETETPLLDRIKYPADLKSLTVAELKQLADEVRRDMVNIVSKTGGHLGAGLGVVPGAFDNDFVGRGASDSDHAFVYGIRIDFLVFKENS